MLCHALPLSGSKWKDDVRFTGLSRQGYRQPGILKLETGRDQMSTLARVRLDHFSTAVGRMMRLELVEYARERSRAAKFKGTRPSP